MSRRPDKHARSMLEELIAERRLGRVSGPYSAPAAWGVRTVPLPTELRDELDPPTGLLPPPTGPVAAAVAFGIEQLSSTGSTKVRRGDDWLRSGHNGAAQVTDRPFHHTVDTHAAAAQALRTAGVQDLAI